MKGQEIGETSDAILRDDEQRVQEILEKHKDKRDPYWIVIFAKPSKRLVAGKPTLVRAFKPYFTKPEPQVGMIVGEVDNTKGTISWDINLPDRPFGYGVLGLEADGHIVQETNIPASYIYTQ